MKQRKEYKHLCDETEYIIKNGMRYVKPYIYRHETNWQTGLEETDL